MSANAVTDAKNNDSAKRANNSGAATLHKMITKEDLRVQLEDMTRRVMDPQIGLYGPDSIAWKVNRHTSILMGAGAANLLQLAHPWVAQAIDQHSQTQTDPLGRLRRTFLNVHSMVFGNLDQVLDSAVKVHNIHAKITGRISESAGSSKAGQEYMANNVGAMLWVHATLWITGLRVYEMFCGPLSKAETDKYYEESKLFAFLFGVPSEAMPENWDGFLAWFNEVIDSDTLAVGNVGRELVDFIFGMRAMLTPVLNRHRIHTTVLLPERLREPFGMPELTPKIQAAFDRDVKLAKTFFKFAPDHIKYIPPYLEAQRRLAGKKADPITRLSNRVIYGQPLLVS